MGVKVTRIATAGQELAGGSTLDATYSGTEVDVTTGLPLDGLLDVNAPTPADNDVLTWDDGAGEWIAAPGGGGLDLTLSTVAAAGATETLDVSTARTHDITLSADCTFTFTGATTGEAWYFTLVLRQDGTGGWTTTWPASVIWPGGAAPTMDETASTTEVLTFFTLDGGTAWFGFESGAAGGGTPATTVTDETTWGITPAVGSDTEYARQDHTHGTPSAPGELLVADTTGGSSGVNDSSYVEMTTQRTTTSASLADITGATTTITLTRAADIAVWMTCHVSASAACDLGLAISIDGTDHDITDTHLTATDEGNVAIMHRSASALQPGTYTVKGRFRRTSGGGTPAVDRADLLVMSMGTGGPVMLVTDDGSDFLYADA